jgi:hypothetical protein
MLFKKQLLMKWKFFSFLLLPLFGNFSFAQYPEKKWFNKNDSTYGYYIVIKPSSLRIQGALILLDGYSGNADNFLSETKIHNVAWNNDILTVCIPTSTHLYADQSMITLLNTIIKEILQTYSLRKDEFVIGGMSSGGTIALRYAELCNEKPSEFPIQPKAVFDVDSPLDLAGLYKSSERDLKKNNGGWWLGEAQMIIDRFKTELGDPYKDLKNYQQVSPFLMDMKDTVNERSLVDIAVRTYHDVDVSWFIQNRGRSLYETNMLDGSELISRLVLLGNKQAEFLASKIPGRRSNGSRHPHSWNIVDEIDLVQWIKEKLHFYPDHLAKPYSYEAPAGWNNEIILFPIDFAPGLSYKGFEDLRFAPGWGDEKSDEKWAYTLLWWFDDTYSFNEKIIQQNLENYFSGLTKRRTVADKLDMASYTPAKVQVQKIKSLKGDIETYTATASIFDAQVTKKPGSLYFKVHIKECADKNRAIVLIETAGSSFNQPVWLKLDKINENFKCEK